MKKAIVSFFTVLVVSSGVYSQQISADKHSYYKNIVATMSAIVKYTGRESKKNSIYVSNVNNQNGKDLAYAYWKEDNSITILSLPLSVPLRKGSSEYYWLRSKARIDLKKGVVKSERDVGGSTYLVSRAWANKIKAQCLNGIRIMLVNRKR